MIAEGTEGARARASRAATTFGRFARDEFRGLAATVGRASGRAWLVVTSLLAIAYIVGTLGGGGAGSSVSAPGRVVLAVMLAAYYGTCAGLFAGLVAGLWRLFGRWALVPIVLVPAAVLGVLALAARPLFGEARDVVDAILVAAKAHHFTMTDRAMGILAGGRGGGGPLLGVLLTLALPFLLLDLISLLLEPAVLWQFAQFVALTALFAAVAAALALVVTAGPLLYGLITRLRRRYQAFLAQTPAT